MIFSEKFDCWSGSPAERVGEGEPDRTEAEHVLYVAVAQRLASVWSRQQRTACRLTVLTLSPGLP